MIKRFKSMALVLACLLGGFHANAEFKDIKIDLTNGNYLTAEEMPAQNQPSLSIGFTVGTDGSVSRVDATDASAAIVLNGKFHSTQHGWQNFSSTVKVDGPVKITFGGCNWGGDVTVKNAASETIATFNTKVGGCWSNKTPGENIASTLYKGDATTLTISGGSYVPYIAVEAVDPSEIVNDATVSFDLGEYAGAGQAPAAEKVEIGKTFTIPANYTIYQEGKTLVGWTDGTKNYEIGEIVTVSGDMTLTPRFVTNTVSLADRTEPLTIKWNFRRDQGCPLVAWQGHTGVFMVAQAKIGTETIDVKLPISTSPGKFNSGSNVDWTQVNEGTTLTVPACKGAIVSFESFEEANKTTPVTTIDGQTLPTSKTPSFTIAGNVETVDIVAGKDIRYLRYVQVVLPVAETAGKTYNNEPATINWPFNDANTYATDYTASPEDAFSFINVELGGTVKGTEASKQNGVTYLKINPATGASDKIKWMVKPVKGLTFTPTKLSGMIARAGTDAKNGMTVTAELSDGTIVTLGTFTGHRINKTQAEDKFSPVGSEAQADFADHFEFTLTEAQQQQLTSADGFYLCCTHGVAADGKKQGCYADIKIEGMLNGTVEAVEKFEVKLATSIEGAGNVEVYPVAEAYEKGSEIKVSTTKNFGYKFVNWTDSDNKVVSTAASFTYTVEKATTLTANYEALTTYELKYGCADGVKSYMVQPSPAPTVVDGKNMYEKGTKVNLTALENDGYTFTNWDNGQSLNPYTVVMDGDKNITANFAATDFIAGWDFYVSGNSSRVADFAAPGNEDVSLNLQNEAGELSGWLDKSTQAAGGCYEDGIPGATNWRTTGLGDYYWQTEINAEAFTDLRVKGSFAFSYNTKSRQVVEVSLDGKIWEELGSVTLVDAKKWYPYNFNLPAKYNNQALVYIRWKADKNSDTALQTTSNNDGVAIGATTIFGTPKLIDDGKAPELLSFVPEDGSTTAPVNGKIVLTFDEKIKVKEGVTATLDGKTLTPAVTGKSVAFAYRNLAYSTDYTFTLPASSVSDLTDNFYDKAITIAFTTKTRPAVEKGEGYDFIVPDDGTFKEAIAAANNRENKSKRFIIFVKKGNYDLPYSETETIIKNGTDNNGNQVTAEMPSPITRLSAANTSIIGEDRDATVIRNLVKDPTPSGTSYPIEGLHNVTTLALERGADNTYIQDITLKNGMNDNTGRGEALGDYSNHTILKNVTLWGYQDTYCGNADNGVYYFEGGVMRGKTDFLCGKGDVFFNGVKLQVCAEGGYIAVPSVCAQFGYVFKDCEIIGEKDGLNKKFTLGRPWGQGTPVAVYIDTKMTVQPKDEGWSEMTGGYPKRFAEYNSMSADGTRLSLSKRKTTFATSYKNDPELTQAEAESYSYDNYSAFHNWDPALIAELAPVPTNVTIDENNRLTWDNSDYAAFWAIFKDGALVATVKEPAYAAEATALSRAEAPVYTVRAANEMGGLGEEVKAEFKSESGIADITADQEVVSTAYYNIQGIAVSENTKGLLIKVETLASGATRTSKVIVK